MTLNELAWPKEALTDWVDRSLEQAARSGSRGIFSRETAADFPTLGVLDSSVHDARFVANGEGVFLGAGSAASWESEELGALESARKALPGLPASCVLMGGWSLPGRKAKGKGGIPRATWVIPSLTFISTEGKTRVVLAANPATPVAELKRHFRGLVEAVFQPEKRASKLNETRSTDVPSKKQWVSMTRSALGSIAEGRFRKVVLARSLRIAFDSDVPISLVVRRLTQANPAATVFAIKRGDQTFLGATPERLFSLKDGQVSVDCLAATAPRSRDSSVDESLGRGLLEDAKSRREHQFVVDGVVSSIARVCKEVRVSGAPKVKKLATVQHLQSFVTGTLRPKKDVWSAALAVWPTAATGGEPRAPALRWIKEHELIDRGWYSGVVGVVRANGDAELAVAIRSGLVEGKNATLYGGAGILEGSNPEAEFAETGWKMRTMMDALVGPAVA